MFYFASVEFYSVFWCGKLCNTKSIQPVNNLLQQLPNIVLIWPHMPL